LFKCIVTWGPRYLNPALDTICSGCMWCNNEQVNYIIEAILYDRNNCTCFLFQSKTQQLQTSADCDETITSSPAATRTHQSQRTPLLYFFLTLVLVLRTQLPGQETPLEETQSARKSDEYKVSGFKASFHIEENIFERSIIYVDTTHDFSIILNKFVTSQWYKDPIKSLIQPCVGAYLFGERIRWLILRKRWDNFFIVSNLQRRWACHNRCKFPLEWNEYA